MVRDVRQAGVEEEWQTGILSVLYSFLYIVSCCILYGLIQELQKCFKYTLFVF